MFDIVEIDQADILTDEQMGTKEKFWFRSPKDDARWLFKYARVNNGHVTGEDWAEKLAHEFAVLLGIPSATVCLAKYKHSYGTISRDFTRHLCTGDLEEGQKSELIHGNELLFHLCDSVYPRDKRFRVAEHTVGRVYDVLKRDGFLAPLGSGVPSSISGAEHVFCGYLMLDALVGNTDRHHENWAVQYIPSVNNKLAYLSPSFDHASSLGRDLLPKRIQNAIRESRLSDQVHRYAARARSALYLNPGDSQSLTPIEALCEYGKFVPGALKYWVERLGAVQDDQLSELVSMVPRVRMLPEVASHTVSLVCMNRHRVLQGLS